MMSEKRFRVNDLVKFDYSEIGEYVDEEHTDKPLRNDEVCDLLNEQQAIIDQLEKENKQLRKTIALFEVEEDEINFLKEVVVVDE